MIWQVLANQISYSRYCLVSLLFVSGEPSRNLRINLHDCGHSLGTVCGRSLPDWLQPRYFYRFTRYVLFPVSKKPILFLLSTPNFTYLRVKMNEKVSFLEIADFWLETSKNDTNIIWRSIKDTQFLILQGCA